MNRLPGIYARGMAMGAADVVPGVSGGTLALITGIYEELIETLTRVRPALLGVWKREGFGAFWRAGNFSFLVTLLAGVVTSIALFARLLTWLMEAYPVPLWAFFCGLIMASVWLVLRPVRRFGPEVWVPLLVAFVIAWWIGSLPGLPAGDEAHLWQVFLSGALAICAMILPGISGSFILVLLGMYGPVLNAVRAFDLQVILIFVAGCATGLLSFVHLLRWLLRRWHDPMMGLLAGFMAGSLNKLWPWRMEVEGGGYANLAPQLYREMTGLPPMVAEAVTAALAGVLLVGVIAWMGIRQGRSTAH